MVITFCGHSKASFSCEEISLLNNLLENKITNEGANTFYLGEFGDFDNLCYSVLRTLKNKYKHIKLVFITPYIYPNYSKAKYATEKYDEIIFPPLETIPIKFAISKRNEWMVDNADFVVAYVKLSFGGAEQMLAYAKRKGKEYINIADRC